MLLTIATTHKPATDLGYLLHKNPARRQEFEMTFGKAFVFTQTPLRKSAGHCQPSLTAGVPSRSSSRQRRAKAGRGGGIRTHDLQLPKIQ